MLEIVVSWKEQRKMKSVYIFMADGFEEIEALAVVDMLRRAQIKVIMVSVMEDRIVKGAHEIQVIADAVFEECEWEDADMLVLPGGSIGAKSLGEHEGLRNILLEYDKKNRWIAAICAAPGVLGQIGLLKDRHATCYPGLEYKMIGAIPESKSVVVDGKYITGRGMGASIEFSLAIIEALEGKGLAEQIQEQIQ